MVAHVDTSRDYYAVLGLTNDATQEDIRKAYRRLALRYHPDKNNGDAGLNERFKGILEAFQILTDPDVKDFAGGRGSQFKDTGQGEHTGDSKPKREKSSYWNHSGTRYGSSYGSGDGFASSNSNSYASANANTGNAQTGSMPSASSDTNSGAHSPYAKAYECGFSTYFYANYKPTSFLEDLEKNSEAAKREYQNVYDKVADAKDRILYAFTAEEKAKRQTRYEEVRQQQFRRRNDKFYWERKLQEHKSRAGIVK